ncbi:MAG: helix-hairpin-helix domain-containing protein [Bacteroidia bacterium]|nr:helix-hairpin-helix domain-containing protein [Bacteroidia bacterium]
MIVLTVSLPRFIFLNKEKIQIDQDSIIKYLAKQEAPKQEDKSTLSNNDNLLFSEQSTNLSDKKSNFEKINLNTCDSLQLVQIRGVGEKTAKKILQVRRKIKIFHSIGQLACIGLYPEIVHRLQQHCYVESDAYKQVQKIELNEVEDKSLFRMPGFTYDIAKSFIKYRKFLKKQGKKITSWQEVLQNVEGIDEQWLSCWQIYYQI